MTSFVADLFAPPLQKLLEQAGWANRPSAILEAMPHLTESITFKDVVGTLENLKIPYVCVTCPEREISSEECPSIVFPEKGRPYFAVSHDDGAFMVLSGQDDKPVKRLAVDGPCVVIKIQSQDIQRDEVTSNSASNAFAEVKPMLPWLLVASFLVNGLGLLAPLLIMVIYDRVIPSGSTYFLMSIAIGAAIILLTDFALRYARTRMIAFVGMRAEHALSLSLFRKLIGLPLSQLQKSNVDQQVSRFRQFEALREVFTGQVTTSLLDLPFVVIFLCVLFYLNPAVGLLVICIALILVLHGIITIPMQQRLDAEASQATMQSRALVYDAIVHQNALVGLGMREDWIARSQKRIAASEALTKKSKQFQTTQQSLVQSLIGLGTVLAIVISAHAALNAQMSFGALIAVIALVSKIMAPIAALHANAMQMVSFRASKAQADRVLSLPQELELGLARSYTRNTAGAISLTGVTHRPDPLNAPVLSQVTLSFAPRETVVVFANDVSSRMALLDLVDGLETPLAGTVELDDVNIRQIASDELRRLITYGTQAPGLFYGTIRQNFKLAEPDISDTDIKAALQELGLLSAVMKLEDGLDTRLSEATLAAMPAELKRGISLARAMARQSSILLLAEPSADLGAETRGKLKQWIASQHGQRTIIIATADRSYLPLADRFVFLGQGKVVVNDKGADGLKKINAALENMGR
ncbi:MAG: ABC transporter transmembrane domain-containing protein [Pseudomonadota bacterium]